MGERPRDSDGENGSVGRVTLNLTGDEALTLINAVDHLQKTSGGENQDVFGAIHDKLEQSLGSAIGQSEGSERDVYRGNCKECGWSETWPGGSDENNPAIDHAMITGHWTFSTERINDE
jgi:hypothetical protein